MTAQISDQFRYKGTQYSLVAISDPMFFSPVEYGIIPEAVCTACWRGYWCGYNITEEGIFLEDLYINAKDDYYPEIAGVAALAESADGEGFEYMGHHLYKGLNIKEAYTGKLLIGDGFIHDYYIHMGYQSAWAFKVLTELVFEDGMLREVNDQSGIAAAIREMISKAEGNAYSVLRNLKREIDNKFASDGNKRIWWL